MITDDDLRQLIEPLLETKLTASGLERISVTSGEDHDGDPLIFIELFFRGRGQSVDHQALMAAMEDVRATISRAGETRFPHIKLHIPDPDESLAA